MLLEGLDGGDGVAGLKAFVVLVYFPADDGLGRGGLAGSGRRRRGAVRS